jgi:hypothetical protein
MRSTAPRSISASCASTGVVMIAADPAEGGSPAAVEDELLFCSMSTAFRWSTPAPPSEAGALPGFLLISGKIQAHQ